MRRNSCGSSFVEGTWLSSALPQRAGRMDGWKNGWMENGWLEGWTVKTRTRNVQQKASGVVSVCVASFSGADHALAALQQVTGAVRHITLADQESRGAQTRVVIERIAELRPRTVILGGWSPHYE